MTWRDLLVALMVGSQLALGGIDIYSGKYRTGAVCWLVAACNLLVMGGK